jgi:hypothetical protein
MHTYNEFFYYKETGVKFVTSNMSSVIGHVTTRVVEMDPKTK